MSRLIQIKIAPKASTPDVVTTAEAKDYSRVDFNEDDTLFAQLIASSRERLEKYCCRVFLESDCEAIYCQEGCGDRILLSYSDNIVLAPGGSYNDLLVGEIYIKTEDKEVKLEYEAGYPTESMPGWIKQAVLMDVAYRYENRGDVAINSGINGEVKEFLRPFVNWSYL